MAEELKACPFCAGKVREPIRICDGYKIVCHCGLTYVGMVSAPEDLIRCWNRRAQQSSKRGEAVAWRVTGRGGITVTAQYPEWAEADCLLSITPLYTHPANAPTDSRVVPVELLERLIDPYRRVPRSIHLHNNDCQELRALLEQNK